MVSARMGAIMNSDTEDVVGYSGSLIKSLIASAMGWRSPYGPIILGPLRNCI